MGDNSAPIANYGTWASIIHEWSDLKPTVQEHMKSYEENISHFKPALPSKWFPHKNRQVYNWAINIFTCDSIVITNTQKFFYEHYQQRPIHLRTYACLNSLPKYFIYAIFISALAFFIKFKAGIYLALKFPVLFSCGYFDHGGPSEKKQSEIKSEIFLVGEGWAEKLADIHEQYSTPPDKIVKARISADNPAYGMTSFAVLLSAFTILTERSKMPQNGGVLSTGAAFAKTTMIQKLHKYGLKFEIL